MSFTDNLMAFNTAIENAIGEIPLADVEKDPDIYRLVKLLSWSKQAAGSTGGGGSTSPIDIASGINASSDIDSILAELQTIATNTGTVGSGTSAATIASGINTASDIDQIITELQSIVTNTAGGSGGTDATTIAAGINQATDIDSLIASLAAIALSTGVAGDNSGDPTLIGLLKALVDKEDTELRTWVLTTDFSGGNTGDVLIEETRDGDFFEWTNITQNNVLIGSDIPSYSDLRLPGEAGAVELAQIADTVGETTDNTTDQTLSGQVKRIGGLLSTVTPGSLTQTFAVDETIANGSSTDLLVSTPTTRYLVGYVFGVDSPCVLTLNVNGNDVWSLQDLDGVERTPPIPITINSNNNVTLSVSEATGPVRITGGLELRV